MGDHVSPVPQFAHEEVKRVYTTHYTEVAYDRIRDCVELPFNVSDQDLADLHEAFPGAVFKPDTTKPQRLHPVAATGLLLTQQALDSKVHDKQYIEIGGAFSGTAAKHSCYKIDGRDEQRVVKARLDTPITGDGNVAKREFLGKVLEGSKDSRYCRDGFHKCDVKAEVAIANNVYDITKEEIAEGFQRHTLDALLVGLILPNEAMYGVSRWNNTYKYGFQARDKKYNQFIDENEEPKTGFFSNIKQRLFGPPDPKLVTTLTKQTGFIEYTEEEFASQYYTMYFKDPSLVYSHKRSTWNFWMTGNTFTARGMNFVMERYRVVGPITIVIITRSRMGCIAESPVVAPLTDEIPLLDITKCYQTLINQFNSYRSSGRAKYIISLMPHVLVPKDLHAKVMAYALAREDGNFTRHHIVSYVRAISQRITIGGTHVQSGFTMDAEEYEAVCVSLFVEACVRRQATTKIIGELIKNITSEVSVLEKLINTFASILGGLNMKDEFQFMKGTTAKQIAKLFTAKAIQMRLIAECTNDQPLSPTHMFVSSDFVGAIPYGPDSLEQSIAALEYGDPTAFVPAGLVPQLQTKHEVSLKCTDGHFQPMLHKDTHCRHGKAFVSSNRSQDYFHFPGLRFAYDEFSADDYVHYQDNKPKTVWKLAHFITAFQKYHTHVIAGEPGNDLSLFSLNGIEVTFHRGPPREDDRAMDICRQFNIPQGMRVNATCAQCLKTIPRKHAIYADIGSGGTDEELVAMQSDALYAIRQSRCKFVLKLQRFFATCANSVRGTGTLVSMMQDCLVFQVKSPNANEAYVTNLCTVGTDCVNINKYGVKFDHVIKPGGANPGTFQPSAPPSLIEGLGFDLDDGARPPIEHSVPFPTAPPLPQAGNPAPAGPGRPSRTTSKLPPHAARQQPKRRTRSASTSTSESSRSSSSSSASSGGTYSYRRSNYSSKNSSGVWSRATSASRGSGVSWPSASSISDSEPELKPVRPAPPPPKPKRSPPPKPKRNAMPAKRPILVASRPAPPPPAPIRPPRAIKINRKKPEAPLARDPTPLRAPPPRPPPPKSYVPSGSEAASSDSGTGKPVDKPAPAADDPSWKRGDKLAEIPALCDRDCPWKAPKWFANPAPKTTGTPLRFKSAKQEGVFLSNFHRCSVAGKLSGRKFHFRNSEGFYQYYKNVDVMKYADARNPNPFEIKKLANKPMCCRHHGLVVMANALAIKFSDRKLLASLLSTGSRPLIEDTHDKFWGGRQGADGHLGHMLERLRAHLRGEAVQEDPIEDEPEEDPPKPADKYVQTATVDLATVVKRGHVLQIGIRSMDAPANLSSEMPNAYAHPKSARNVPTVHGNLITLWSVLNGGKNDKYDTEAHRQRRFERMFDDVMRTRKIPSIHVPASIGCGSLGGDPDEWHELLVKLANRHKVYITKAEKPSREQCHVPQKPKNTIKPAARQPAADAGAVPFRQFTSNIFPAHRRVDVRGDGNCLPRAISYVLYGNERRYEELLKGYEKSADDREDSFFGEELIVHIVLNYGIIVAVVRGNNTFVYGDKGVLVPLHLAHAHYNALVPPENDCYYDDELPLVIRHEGTPKDFVNKLFKVEMPDQRYEKTLHTFHVDGGRAGMLMRRTQVAGEIAANARKIFSTYKDVLLPTSKVNAYNSAQERHIYQNLACVFGANVRFYDEAQFSGECEACQSMATYPLTGVKVEGNTVDTADFSRELARASHTNIKMSDKVVRGMLQSLKRELSTTKNSKPEFIALNRAAMANVDKLLHSKSDLKIDKDLEGFTGVPGSGKTYTITKNYNGAGYDVVVPFKRLLEEYRNAGFKGKTHVAGVDSRHRERIILDEVFALSPGLFVYYLCTSGKVVVIGDPYQMYNVDELDVYKGVHVRDLFDYSKLTMLNHSFTVPHDVCAYLNATAYKDRPFTTSSKVLNSVEYVLHGGVPKDELVYSFTTNYALRQGAVTVASIQGMRQKTTRLMVESNSVCILRKIPEQVVVALSRHTEKIYIHLATESMKSFLCVKPLVVSKHTCLVGGFKQFDRVGYTSIYSAVEFGKAPENVEDERLVPRYTKPAPETKRKIRARAKMETRLGLDSIKVGVINRTENVDTNVVSRTAYVTLPNATLASVDAAGIPLISDGGPMEPATDVSPHLKFEDDNCEIVEHCLVRGVSIPVVEDILNRISPSSSEIEAIHYGYDHLDFERSQGPLTIYPSIVQSTIEIGEESTRVFKKLPIKLRGRPCDFRNKSQQLHCMIRRYGQNKNPHPVQTPTQAANQLFSGFQRMCNFGPFPQVTPELISLCFAEQMLKIKMKGDILQAAEYDLIQREFSSRISCFLKNQTKKDLSEDSWLKPDKGDIKAGQGISAQPKMVNIMVGCLVRAVSKLIESVLRPEVVLGSGIDPLDLSERIKRMNIPDEAQGLEVDVSEFDSQRGEWTDIFMDKVYSSFGIDPKNMAYMTALNKQWTLDAGDLKLGVRGHFQSGRADTLLSNTLVSVAFFGSFFQETGLKLALFQGDDVCVVADHVDQVVDRSFLKVQLSAMPSFCGYMLHNGLTIDVPAMCAKLSNRLFADEASIASYRLGVSDWMRTVRSTDELHMSMHCAAYKYGISFEEVAYLHGFLNDFAAGRLVKNFNSRDLVLMRTYGVPVFR